MELMLTFWTTGFSGPETYLSRCKLISVFSVQIRSSFVKGRYDVNEAGMSLLSVPRAQSAGPAYMVRGRTFRLQTFKHVTASLSNFVSTSGSDFRLCRDRRRVLAIFRVNYVDLPATKFL